MSPGEDSAPFDTNSILVASARRSGPGSTAWQDLQIWRSYPNASCTDVARWVSPRNPGDACLQRHHGAPLRSTCRKAPAFAEKIKTTGYLGSWGRFPAQLERAQLNSASPPRRLRTPWRSTAFMPSNLSYSWSKLVRLSHARRMAMRIGALCTPA